MLYIKTAAAANRMRPSGAIMVNAAEAGLDPACENRTAYDTFLRSWNDTGLSPSDTSENGRRLAYDLFRSGAMRELSLDSRAQKSILDVVDHVMSGQDVVMYVKESRPFRSSRRRLLAELFISAGVSDILADARIGPGEIRAMDPVTGKTQENTEIWYAAMNGPGIATTVVTGILSGAQKAAILSACKRDNSRLLFVPAGIGLPLPTGVSGKEPWAVLGPGPNDAFRTVTSPDDSGIHVGHLTALFEKNAPYWDSMALQRINGWCAF